MMKKLICILLACLMLVSVVACGSTPTVDPVDTDESVEETEATGGKVAAPAYNGVFKTGYARVVITPSVPIGNRTKVADDIYSTCVAVNDGETTALFFTIAQGSISETNCDAIRNVVTKKTKVAKENIFISATHTHSAPGFDSFKSQEKLSTFNNIAASAQEAIDDLADTEVFIGTGKTTGMAFVRRYVAADGSMSSVNPASNAIKSVGEADDTLQVVRFVRADKKDIVITNWQCHLAHADPMMPTSISSDIEHYMRQDIEAGDDDTLVAYFAGASGNINLNPPNRSFRKYKDYKEVAQALAQVTLDVLKAENLTKIEAGKIQITKEVYAAAQRKDAPEVVAAAQARINAGKGSKEDRYLVAGNQADTRDLRIAAISFGDLALITVPYEMFDNNGMQVKEGSPFKMTVVITNADGDYAYMPSYEACTEYGGYEVEASYFGAGTAEAVVEQYLRMLNAHKGIS